MNEQELQGFTLVEGSQSQETAVNTMELIPELPLASTQAEEAGSTGGSLQEMIPLALCDEELLQELGAIPNRLAFKIGDVAELVGVKTYVLRYWETEFDVLNPKKSKNNQRVYSKRDVENVMLIKKLLYRDRFSIEGARTALKQLRTQVKKERTLITAQNRYDAAIEKVHDLIFEIRRIEQLFI